MKSLQKRSATKLRIASRILTFLGFSLSTSNTAGVGVTDGLISAVGSGEIMTMTPDVGEIVDEDGVTVGFVLGVGDGLGVAVGPDAVGYGVFVGELGLIVGVTTQVQSAVSLHCGFLHALL